ncbi:hypothetical protein DRP44_07275 [candidate division TA06 bacterium]|uniref:C4-type zinc ribbon domain-containing protein n=1 Tax=candidate division TA06 bacterium TaxID=2250710 RepID=A0A660S5K6_UNCT6|nr:MAG: hypothetical protein DRP44_07275 [candidate division TA06 bacterium]
MLKDDLKYLYEIQKLDIEIDELSTNLESIPERIRQLTLDLEKHKNSIEKEKEAIEHLKESKSDVEKKLSNIKIALEKNKKKEKVIKTGREGESLLKEKENLMRDEEFYTNKLKEINDKIEKSTMNLSNLEDSLEDVINSTKEDIKLYNEKEQELKNEIEELEDKKKRIAVHIEDPAIVKKYERIRENRDGVGVVVIDKPICGGCFVKLPQEIYNELKRGEEIYYCEICGRILLWKGFIDE